MRTLPERRAPRRALARVLVAAVGIAAVMPAAGDVQDEVNQLIAALSKETRQAHEMAAKLLNAAAGLKDKPELQLALYAACYDYAVKSYQGYETGVKAAEGALALRPETPGEWWERLVRMQRFQFNSARGKEKEEAAARLMDSLLRLGDAQFGQEQFEPATSSFREAYSLARLLRSQPAAGLAQWKLMVTAAAQRVHGEIRICMARLARDPNDAAGSRRLVELYVTELDHPAAAQGLLNVGCDEAYRGNVPLAAGPAGKLDEAQCRLLAGWYAGLAEGASALGRPRMLVRGIRYLEAFLTLQRQQSITVLAARAELGNLRKRLAAYPFFGVPGTITGGADDRFILCLNGKEISRNHRNCGPGNPASVILKPGDVLCARAWNVMAGRCFFIEFRGEDEKIGLATGPPWRICKPDDGRKWWEFTPSPADPPCVPHGQGTRIWGDSNPSFLYHIVTAVDLDPKP